jgi:hypothetical protein
MKECNETNFDAGTAGVIPGPDVDTSGTTGTTDDAAACDDADATGAGDVTDGDTAAAAGTTDII